MTEEHRSATPPGNLPSTGPGAHAKIPGEKIKSRSADPGQSSYGGFTGEDPTRQAQDLPKTSGHQADTNREGDK